MTRSLLVLLFFAAAAVAQDDDPWADDWDEGWDEDEPAVVVTGFAELAAGARPGDPDTAPRRATLADARLRAEAEWTGKSVELAAVADAWYDGVDSALEAEVRELSAAISPAARIDAKIGRQVLTWGTGDLLFLNDLFPKDFVSFFAGRDDEYLKAPSDTVKIGFSG